MSYTFKWLPLCQMKNTGTARSKAVWLHQAFNSNNTAAEMKLQIEPKATSTCYEQHKTPGTMPTGTVSHFHRFLCRCLKHIHRQGRWYPCSKRLIFACPKFKTTTLYQKLNENYLISKIKAWCHFLPYEGLSSSAPQQRQLLRPPTVQQSMPGHSWLSKLDTCLLWKTARWRPCTCQCVPKSMVNAHRHPACHKQQ